jgi:hypothetical protein
VLTTWGYLTEKSQKKEKMDAKKVKIVSLLGASMGLLCILLVSNIYLSLHDHDLKIVVLEIF